MIRILTTADTEVQSLAAAVRRLPEGFEMPVRAGSPNDLTRPGALDRFLAEGLDGCRALVVRVLGGLPYFTEGFERLSQACRERTIPFLALPGERGADPALAALSTVPLPLIAQVASYFDEGGADNLAQMLLGLSDALLGTNWGHRPPIAWPREGLYHPRLPGIPDIGDWLRSLPHPGAPTVGILFYRAHWLSGNLRPVDALIERIETLNGNALGLWCYSLKDADPSGMPAAFRPILDAEGTPCVDALISTLSFTAATLGDESHTESSGPILDALDRLDLPVLQAILSSSREEDWANSRAGLTPRDAAMNVVLPEFDGRIITTAISFKEEGHFDPSIGAPIREYVSKPDRIDSVASLALSFARLARTPNPKKKIAILFGNYPWKNARIGNGVGLDTPASVMNVLRTLKGNGYTVEDIPPDGDALMHRLIDGGTFDEEFLTEEQSRKAAGHVSLRQYDGWFNELPATSRRAMIERWGVPLGTVGRIEDKLAIPGLILGNVFIGIQPPRGFGADPMAIYHSPDLPPTHHYLAYYRWLRSEFRADAVIHMGKHGNLEWLPGKAIGLSAGCYPEAILGDLPNFYPYIINNPGEGTQAKRRAHAVILDHLIPPMTRAETYDDLARLEQLIDEYYRMASLDPTKLPSLFEEIWDLYVRNNLHRDLNAPCGPVGQLYKPGGLSQAGPTHTHRKTGPQATPKPSCVLPDRPEGEAIHAFLQEIDGYLCELGDAQIRDGLHILGEMPDGQPLVDLLGSLVRLPNGDVPSLRDAMLQSWGFEAKDFHGELGDRLGNMLSEPQLRTVAERMLYVWAAEREAEGRPKDEAFDINSILAELRRCTKAGIVQRLTASIAEDIRLLVKLLGDLSWSDIDAFMKDWGYSGAVRPTMAFLGDEVVPRLRRTTDEVTNLLRGLSGGFVPAGPSGAPSRGMARILPTGRNFYSVDVHAIPSEAAWRVGVQAGDRLIEKYRAEHDGEYPRTVGLIVWGTSTMRTHGDDVAEILHLMGCRPKWTRENRRVAGVELVPLEELGRPRVDVTVRISGFFRDAFPNVVALIDDAVRLVAEARESERNNPLRAHIAREVADGVPENEARYRIFGSKPGAYGAGLLNLIDERNWKTVDDLATVYIAWGSYAYTRTEHGTAAALPFQRRLSMVNVAAQNQDNREHDIFDSDDYFQYHGGMIAAIRALTGRNPSAYFGDTSDPSRVRVRDLQEEAHRVFRSRVVNPKWIAGVMRHGYKGASEMAATVDYLFGFAATAQVVEGWMFEGVARSYLQDEAVRDFLQNSNPWALRAMAERLLEAADRGVWESPDPGVLADLRSIYLANEHALETRP